MRPLPGPRDAPAFEETMRRGGELAERAEGEIIRLHATGADDTQAGSRRQIADGAPKMSRRASSRCHRRLKECEAKLDDYTERVFNTLHAT